jgi:hypothetical protein
MDSIIIANEELCTEADLLTDIELLSDIELAQIGGGAGAFLL